MAFRSLCLCVVLKNIICKMLAADSLMFAWDERLTINSLSVNVCQPLLGPVFVRSRKFEKVAGLPTCTDFRGTYRFWPSITISRFHAVVYRFWKMREFLGLSDFGLFCFRRYSRILPAFCTYRQSRRCVAAINSPP